MTAPAAGSDRQPAFHVLGMLTIADGREAVVLPPSKPTILLAALLLNPGGVVSVGTLQQAVWGDEQPALSRAALQNCVLRLRQLFGRHGIANTVVETVPGGYRIVAGADTLDLLAFRELVRRAAGEGDPDEECHLLDEALALWRGPLLANVPSESLHRDAVPRLTEERLRSFERVCDLKIALGTARTALPELWTATRVHPGNERLSEQLARALYVTGRQPEALAEIRRLKDYLRGELGLDAGRSLHELERAILQGEDIGPAAAAGPRRIRSAAAPGGVVEPPAALRLPTMPHFVGRAGTTAAILDRLGAGSGGRQLTLLSGPPGIGKTALALHVAELAGREPGAGPQLLVPMSDARGRQRPAAEVAGDVAAASEQARLAAAAGSGPALVVLDDVVDSEQLQAVLAVLTAPAAVILTSRRSLAESVARYGVGVHRLGVFTRAESRELLVALLGPERAGAESAALAALADACGHYPLALRIAATRLVTRPRLRIADVLGWLGDDPFGRLALPGEAHLSVSHCMYSWLDQLDPELVGAFVRIGSSVRSSFSLTTGAQLLGSSRAATAELLDHLVEANLLEEGPGHYTMHDLLRGLARSTVIRGEDDAVSV